MRQKPTIVIAAILVALALGYLAWREQGPQPAQPDRPAGFQSDKPGGKP